MKKRMIGVLLLLGLLVLGGISPLLNETTNVFFALLDFYQDEVPTVNDGGGGGGWPDGDGS
ncbi:MAG: hypothetical protein HXS44_13370 [Theionarchaea archaeon]|nr:hypothetical protein [Theionarchaea archaeon]